MNSKFPILSFISFILRIVGWIIALGGGYFIVYEGIIEPNQPGHTFGNADKIEIVTGFALILFGLFCAAFSEIIGVMFAIEENTRKISIIHEKK